jgi:hypothetical protein
MPNDTPPSVRGRPFTKGNGGRKPGSRNKTTEVAAALLQGEEEDLVRKAVEIAKAGDVAMLKFLLGRILPRDRAIKMELPHEYQSNEDRLNAIAAVILAVAEGKLSPAEGAAIASLMDSYRRAAEDSELWKDVDALKDELILARIELERSAKLK